MIEGLLDGGEEAAAAERVGVGGDDDEEVVWHSSRSHWAYIYVEISQV